MAIRSSEQAEIIQQHEEKYGILQQTQMFFISNTVHSVKSRLLELGYAEDDWTYRIDGNHSEEMKIWAKMTRQKKKFTERCTYICYAAIRHAFMPYA